MPLHVELDWTLATTPTDLTGPRVVSTFSGGGGSSMGYRLAGMNVTSACDIDPVMSDHYRTNLDPPQFHQRPVLDLIDLDLGPFDILDGSPPCSSFSTSGRRDKDWGKNKQFREGQATQVLDDLFFDWIKVVAAHLPRIVIAENVTGLAKGKARGYLRLVVDNLRTLGYQVEVHVLNATQFGVPQRRERVFILGTRTKQPALRWPDPIPPITCQQAVTGIINSPEQVEEVTVPTDSQTYYWWKRTEPGKRFMDTRRAEIGWDHRIQHPDRPAWTLTGGNGAMHWAEPRRFTSRELARLSSFPDDYKFGSAALAGYIVGMSVPPRLTAGVAQVVKDQWM